MSPTLSLRQRSNAMLHRRVLVRGRQRHHGHGSNADDGIRSSSSNVLTGTLRFVGETDFNRSTFWLGVELDLPNGKHNGTVNGVGYFDCAPGHGIFVKPTAVCLAADDV